MAVKVEIAFSKTRDLDVGHDREITVWLDEENEDESRDALKQLVEMASPGAQMPSSTGSDDAPDDPYDKLDGTSGDGVSTGLYDEKSL